MHAILMKIYTEFINFVFCLKNLKTIHTMLKPNVYDLKIIRMVEAFVA